MSIPVIEVINDVALKMGDPGFTQITTDEYLRWANQRSRKLSTKLNLVKWVAFTDLEQDNELYAEPDDCLQITRLSYSPTPTDARTFRDLHPYFADEFRARVNWTYPVGEPDSYFPDQGFFYLVGRPTASLAQALKIEYWGLPEDMTSASTDTIPFMAKMRDLLADGIEIDALWKLEKREESIAAGKVWEATIGSVRPKLENPATDRRSSVRVSRVSARMWRQV